VDFNEDSPAEHSVELASELVLAHLQRYPQAADTIHGIALWWLGPSSGSIPLDALALALERLANKGVMANRNLPSGEMLWYALHVPPADPASNGR